MDRNDSPSAGPAVGQPERSPNFGGRRDVFTADPKAPISAVAERAGVGISALYRRYRRKEELLQELNLNGLREYNDEWRPRSAMTAIPWDAFSAFMRRAVAADTSSLTLHLAGVHSH